MTENVLKKVELGIYTDSYYSNLDFKLFSYDF